MRTSPGEPWAAPVNPRIVMLHEPGLPRDYCDGSSGRRKRNLETGDESGTDRVEGDIRRGRVWADLGDAAAVRADFLVRGGWHVVHAGSRGTPVGPPRRGLAGDFLRGEIERDLCPVDELRAARGRKDKRSQGLWDHLAVWLYARGNVNRRALAALLNYDRKTIDRLHERGRRMLELLEQIDGKLDLVIERLRGTNPTPEEIAETIDDLIADVLREAA
jgi:hypothetical protein